MKKFLAVTIFLMVLMSTVSVAEQTCIGSWANVCETDDSETILTAFRLFPDHSVAYVSQRFPDGDNMSGMFTWEEVENNFRILSDKGQIIGEFFPLNKNRVEDKQGNMFAKISFEYVAETVPSAIASPTPVVTEQEEKKKADLDPVGKWSFYWDARELNRLLGADRMSFDIQSYDLFLLDNGAAYMQKASVKNGKEDFSADMLSGIWLGDASDLTIRVGELTYKAWIDASGRLFWKTTDQMAMIFNRTDFYNYEEGFLK